MNNIQSEILNDLRLARQSIKVAVSWLTDTLLLNELIAAKNRGVDVKIIVSSNELNIIRFELFQKLIDKGAIVNKEGSEEPEQGNFMHYKFYIIDDKISKSGSYNWSVNALTNREALDNVSVSKKITDFNECLKASVNFFHDIVNPEIKRAELQLIEKEHKDVLTPEKLAAYRQTQAAIKEQEARHKKEIEKKEQQRKEAEEGRKRAEEKAANEKKEKEKILAAQKVKEQQAQYKPKEAVKVAQVPPTSYGTI
jgi:phosphatidylserine/phosphatidylglycerophosphate/cardiolipin synthase-like enzyme